MTKFAVHFTEFDGAARTYRRLRFNTEASANDFAAMADSGRLNGPNYCISIRRVEPQA